MPRIQQLLRKHICQRPILHLSFFDGIGAASVALQYLGANIVFTLSWETNPQCQALLQHHFQSMFPSWPDPSSTSSSGALPKAQMIWSSWSHPVHPVSTSPGSGTYHQVCKANRGTCYPDRPKSYLALRKTGATYTWYCLSSRTWYHTKPSVISSRTSHPGSEPHPWWLTPRHHLQTETLVVRHRLGQCNPTTTLQHSMADHTDIPSNYVAPDQPHCRPTPTRRSDQRLGNPNSPPT